MKEHEVIIRPYFSEYVFSLASNENKIAFVVNRRANKYQIREAVEKLLDVVVIKVNTLITPQGFKKAYVKLSRHSNALDKMNDLGLI